MKWCGIACKKAKSENKNPSHHTAPQQALPVPAASSTGTCWIGLWWGSAALAALLPHAQHPCLMHSTLPHRWLSRRAAPLAEKHTPVPRSPGPFGRHLLAPFPTCLPVEAWLFISYLAQRWEESSQKKRMKNKPEKRKNAHLATTEIPLDDDVLGRLCEVPSVTAIRTGGRRQGDRNHYAENSLEISRGTWVCARLQLPLLLLCWVVLIILCSSGSFQVIALKIPYLQWLKIISFFLFIDLLLYLYDLPFPNISQGFKNNNLSFLPCQPNLISSCSSV